MFIAGVLGLLLYAMALQRGTVTVATAAVVVTETLVPAAIGITLLGDRPAPGRTPLAAAGFAITVTGSLLLGTTNTPTLDSAIAVSVKYDRTKASVTTLTSGAAKPAPSSVSIISWKN